MYAFEYFTPILKTKVLIRSWSDYASWTKKNLERIQGALNLGIGWVFLILNAFCTRWFTYFSFKNFAWLHQLEEHSESIIIRSIRWQHSSHKTARFCRTCPFAQKKYISSGERHISNWRNISILIDQGNEQMFVCAIKWCKSCSSNNQKDLHKMADWKSLSDIILRDIDNSQS